MKLINQNCPAAGLPKTPQNTAITTGSGDLVCVVFGENHKAQANMFSAAPDLFEALEGLVELTETLGIQDNAPMNAAYAALERAKGGGNG